MHVTYDTYHVHHCREEVGSAAGARARPADGVVYPDAQGVAEDEDVDDGDQGSGAGAKQQHGELAGTRLFGPNTEHKDVYRLEHHCGAIDDSHRGIRAVDGQAVAKPNCDVDEARDWWHQGADPGCGSCPLAPPYILESPAATSLNCSVLCMDRRWLKME